MTEEQASLVEDGYDASALTERHKVVLRYTDVFLNDPGRLDPALGDELRTYLTDDQVVELTTALALFHGFSKMLITLGLEPDQMDTIVVPTPDIPAAR